jgi:RecA/RadA recombinase
MYPIDLTKLKKTPRQAAKYDFDALKTLMTKQGYEEGFHDVQIWIPTGNYTLNKLLSGSFFNGIALGKVTVFAGESGSGKSYCVSGSIVRYAQAMGINPVLLDSEYALDKSWMERVGVDLSEGMIQRYPVDTVSSVAGFISTFFKDYIKRHGDKPYDDRPAILFVIDSLGQLTTETEQDQFDKGELKGDMGRKAKQLKAMIQQCLRLFGAQPIGMVCTNHTYKSQDQFNPDDVVSGGSGPIFTADAVVSMNKLKLKTDANGVKGKDVLGIRSKIKIVKTRNAKPFEELELEIPFKTGLDPYSGLIDYFEKRGILKKAGSYLQYTTLDGTKWSEYAKNFTDEMLDQIMNEVEQIDADDVQVGFDATREFVAEAFGEDDLAAHDAEEDMG